MADIKIHLEEKTQIIHLRVEGSFDIEESQRITGMIVGLKKELLDPDKIRVLSMSDAAAKPTPGARRHFFENIRRDDFYKLAVVGKNPYMRAVVTFFHLVSGSKKMRAFAREEEAVAWLTE